MISGTLSLFHWSLRADVRSFWPHLLRVGFAGFMLLTVLGHVEIEASGTGLRYFTDICLMNVLFISVAGVSYFVSAVTEEKESGSLDLLRLAGVTPLAIILSKSTSRFLSSLMLLLIQLPFTFLAVTLGGVLWLQIVAAYLALTAWLMLVSAVALFSSVRCQTAGRAAGMAGAILLMLFLLRPLIQLTVTSVPAGWISPPVSGVLDQISAAIQTISIWDRVTEVLAVTNTVPQFLSPHLWWNVGIAAVLFAVSTMMFDRWSPPSSSDVHGDHAIVRRWTVGRCWRHAVMWKDFLFFTGGRVFFVVRLLSYTLLVLGFVWFQQLTAPWLTSWLEGELAITAFVVLLGIFFVETQVCAAGILFTEVRQGTLSSLAMLPTSPLQVVLQKLLACGVSLLPSLLLTVVVFVIAPNDVLSVMTPEAVISFLFVWALHSHLAMLLSLYTRWAALPLAMMLCSGTVMCCPFFAVMIVVTMSPYGLLGSMPYSLVLGYLLNVLWQYGFILLPIEVEIIRRWTELSRA